MILRLTTLGRETLADGANRATRAVTLILAAVVELTAAAAVGTPVSVTATTPTLVTSGPLTLPASLATYRAEAQKGTTWIRIWGATLVIS